MNNGGVSIYRLTLDERAWLSVRRAFAVGGPRSMLSAVCLRSGRYPPRDSMIGEIVWFVAEHKGWDELVVHVRSPRGAS